MKFLDAPATRECLGRTSRQDEGLRCLAICFLIVVGLVVLLALLGSNPENLPPAWRDITVP